MQECKFCGMPLNSKDDEMCDVCKNDDFKEQVAPDDDIEDEF